MGSKEHSAASEAEIVKLIPIPTYPSCVQILWRLLAHRSPQQNISHREMPTPDAHKRFVLNHPYEVWNIIEVNGYPVGAIYLSKPGSPSVPGNEIGIDIFKEHQGKGYGTQAVKLLMKMHGPRRYCANTSPTNEASQALFKSLGFKLVQYTYALEAE